MLRRAGWILDHQEHTFHGLQEGINYSFTVTQTGFSGGRMLSTAPVHARTFTTGMNSQIKTVMSVHFSKKLQSQSKHRPVVLFLFSHTVVTDKLKGWYLVEGPNSS